MGQVSCCFRRTTLTLTAVPSEAGLWPTFHVAEQGGERWVPMDELRDFHTSFHPFHPASLLGE